MAVLFRDCYISWCATLMYSYTLLVSRQDGAGRRVAAAGRGSDVDITPSSSCRRTVALSCGASGASGARRGWSRNSTWKSPISPGLRGWPVPHNSGEVAKSPWKSWAKHPTEGDVLHMKLLEGMKLKASMMQKWRFLLDLGNRKSIRNWSLLTGNIVKPQLIRENPIWHLSSICQVKFTSTSLNIPEHMSHNVDLFENRVPQNPAVYHSLSVFSRLKLPFLRQTCLAERN